MSHLKIPMCPESNTSCKKEFEKLQLDVSQQTTEDCKLCKKEMEVITETGLTGYNLPTSCSKCDT